MGTSALPTLLRLNGPMTPLFVAKFRVTLLSISITFTPSLQDFHSPSVPIQQTKWLCSKRVIPSPKKSTTRWSGSVTSVSRPSCSAGGTRTPGLTTSSMRRTSSPLKNGSCSSLMGVQPTILQALTSKGDLGGVTGVRWTLSLMSTNINKDYQA